MYTYKTQKTLAQKKKQAIRRLSQTGRTRTLSSSSSKQSSKTEAAPGANPFLAALQTIAPVSSSSSSSSHKNVFFEQQAAAASDDTAKEDQSGTPEGVVMTNRPLSYAGAVKSTMNKPNVNPFVQAYSASASSNPGPSYSHPGPASSHSLHLKGVPHHFNNKEFLWRHFEKFGPLREINCHPEKKFADIHFTTQRGAILAKSHGKYLSDNAPPLSIFWFSDKTKGPSGSGGAPVSHGLQSFSAQPSPSSSPHQRPTLSPAKRGEGGAQMPSLTAAGTTRKRIHYSHEEQEQEYVPTLFDVEYNQEEEREDEGLDEGVPEGKDSVLSEEPLPDDEFKMDTIARVPKHKYYLRSIYQPEKSTDGVKASSSVERKATPAVRVPPLADPRKGQSAIERFEALDARDKEIRKNIVKDTSLSAKAKVGCCPDMCPEKERYQREYQRRLSMFEVDNSIETEPGQGPRVNHSLAIKEYSRSAADKDEPLPHELRPLPILIMTMDHIVTAIMDAGEGHVSEWYNFIWDRTRAITTDITYQQLSHPHCVHLIEQFARFHIMCSHILCEEEVSVFDPKMNAETLSNHLQSLHQLYKDLSQEKGITCKNEAEFCCYDILLHLMDGNVFNKVEQYNQSIRRSSEVQFAISVVQSVDSNNFVRFFKLVKKASYLSSCLLHSYFDLIRLRALKTLNQSHSSGKSNPMHFSLTDLTRMLQFGSEDEAADFCSYFGFNIIKDKVQFQRGSETEEYDPGAVKLRYDNHLLSSKDVDKSYGEIVYGGPLPPCPNHTPTCSFTGSGVTQQPAPKINEEEIISVVTDITNTVINDELKEISTNLIKQTEKDELVTSISINTVNELMTQVLVSYCTEISQELLTELMKERDLRDQEEFKAKLCLEISNEILINALRAESRLVATEAITDAVLSFEALNRAVQSLVSELVDSVCVSMTRETAHECMAIAKKERNEKLAAKRLQHQRWRLKQYWIKWIRSLKRRRHIHISISTFPSTGPLIPLSSQLNLLVKSPTNLSSSPKRRRLEQSSSLANLTREDFISSINYSSLLPSGPHRTNIHWNLLLINGSATPLVGEEHQLLWEWLVNKLGYVKQQNEELENVCYTLANNETLKVSIKVLTVAQLSTNINIINDDLISTVLLYLPLVTSPQCYTEQVLGVANDVVRFLVPFAQVPLVILTPSQLHFLHQFHLSQEMEFCNWPLFSKLLVHPLVENNDWKQNEQKLFSLVEWCLNSSPSLPPVQWMRGENYINEMINVNVIKPLLSDAQVRSASGLPSQSPGVIVGLYNSVLDYLSQKILLKPSLTSLPITLIQSRPDTPPYWVPSQPDAVHKFQSILESLRLPHPQPNPPHRSLNDTRGSCMAYVQSVDNNFFLISRVKSLLLRDSSVPWDHILLICIQHLLLCSSDPLNKVLVGMSRVRQEEAEFIPPTEWRAAVVDSLTATTGEGERRTSNDEGQGLRKRRFSDPSSHFSSSPREPKAVRLSLGGADPAHSDHMTGFNARLEYEKTATMEFDEQLQRYLLEPEDIRGRRNDENEQGGQPLSVHSKPLSECINSLEDEIMKLRWREKLDRFSIIKNTF
ncbi:PREDICTED: germinal-center associated nuclear protein-like isoform X2 [Amphimedon queenslandica]|uniref:PCI domain-containing protein n=1 Tax=Amphimedon queenslandica TaxID=400682 RepID=A0AAN0J0L8_AMPQE|nr:PREDICTED: germinal-center associated nuclear protein-like isoform X2 [Amphimedon queenslandica]|eukprot:XP_019850266.1 PREDICTED: germinal-center associated nuclear protein-like isoform X2 [Amphimedon queenslandica]